MDAEGGVWRPAISPFARRRARPNARTARRRRARPPKAVAGRPPALEVPRPHASRRDAPDFRPRGIAPRKAPKKIGIAATRTTLAASGVMASDLTPTMAASTDCAGQQREDRKGRCRPYCGIHRISLRAPLDKRSRIDRLARANQVTGGVDPGRRGSRAGRLAAAPRRRGSRRCPPGTAPSSRRPSRRRRRARRPPRSRDRRGRSRRRGRWSYGMSAPAMFAPTSRPWLIA